ncbi:MAG: exodeoxyribonuclease VII large subunit [Bryobacteraceae bacterium]|nr:exodeoxyribonuclease VII large subunit [Bryobacteraceae bacterium]
MEQMNLALAGAPRVYTVSELDARLRNALEEEFTDIWVAGEVSGTKEYGSGHCYFTLKDRESQLNCVCFRGTLRYLRFKPQDGVFVHARGRLDLFPGRIAVQMVVEALEPQGHGALQFAFEQLKRKLALEGLFDAARKRPLPKLPRRVGIVTSPSGAVIRDMVNILSRRFPGIHVRLYPAQVQGEGSAEQVCRGLEYFSRSGWADVVIVGRGGGSLEDLWTFNEEAVARAIVASAAPVISAVGHETDFTISDFVADLRAPTPSAAAELVICTRQEILDRIAAAAERLGRIARLRVAESGRRLHQLGIDRPSAVLHRRVGRLMQRADECEWRLRAAMRAALEERARRLSSAEETLRRLDVRMRLAAARRRMENAQERLRRVDLRWRVSNARRRVEGGQGSLVSRTRELLASARAGVDRAEAQLRQLSPERVLERGYAIVEDSEGRLLRSAEGVKVGTALSIRLAQGRLAAKVTRPPKPY